MDARSLSQRIPEVQVVDVREPTEWEAGRIASARHVPLGDLAGRLDDFDPHRPVVTVCRTGSRSARAAAILREEGFQADSLEGGLLAWDTAGLPLTRPDGRPGEVVAQPKPSDREQDLGRFGGALLEVITAIEERFGGREPTDEEVREFLKARLLADGHSPEEAERILDGE